LTAKKLLVFAASRSLADDPDAAAWTREATRLELASLPTGSHVLSGGGDGPETWLRDMSASLGLTLTEYRRDGNRWVGGAPTGRWEPTPGESPSRSRKIAVMRGASKAKELGWDVSVVVLSDPSSNSDGDQYTVARAHAAGLRLRHLSYTHARPPGERPVVWIDTETTGRTPGVNGVIEIGCVRTDGAHKRVLDTFEARIPLEPWMVVEPEALRVNGYTEHRWRDARPSNVVFRQLLEWLPTGFTMGAYNHTFDRGMIAAECERLGLPKPGWAASCIDPLPSARRVLKKPGKTSGAKLTDVCDYYGIPNIGAHSALSDAHRARLVYLALMGDDVQARVSEMTVG